ncbi:hypothetical protein JZ751_008886 [Albula glossodonta]|uniref:Uncharacterized protein n=1 Tax=Albula glossodonta TaxID=121402 RepID=A0A8T2P7Z8_9TELE|nr:hypothetical protein JZ751_008886 [Albula glossodonta]
MVSIISDLDPLKSWNVLSGRRSAKTIALVRKERNGRLSPQQGIAAPPPSPPGQWLSSCGHSTLGL